MSQTVTTVDACGSLGHVTFLSLRPLQSSRPPLSAAARSSTVWWTGRASPSAGGVTPTRTATTARTRADVREPSGCATPRPSSPAKTPVIHRRP